MTLEIKNLCKKYSNFNLTDINLSIPKGMIVGLVGKNGAGKSTIIKSIFDIVKRDSGEVNFYGQVLDANSKYLKNDIGVVFDTLSFNEMFTIKMIEKVLRDLYKNFDSELFHSYLDKYELPRDKKFKTFSRGMGMKLSIAIALSHGAKLLVLDEATAGLDPVIREEILDTFLDFVANGENSILVSSHISSDLERIADRIAFIDKGEIILTSDKDSLLYEYGIARVKEEDFNKFDKQDYIAWRKRGLQFEVLVKNKKQMLNNYPNIVIDTAKIDEILPILIKGDN